MRKRIITIILIAIVSIITISYLYYFYQTTTYHSDKLSNENLKGFVKKITSSEVLFNNNLEIYDFNGDLKMRTDASITIQSLYSDNIGDNNGTKSLELNNYFTCKYEMSKLDNENYEYFFQSKKEELKNTIDININENNEWAEYSVSENEFLYVELVNKKGQVFKTYNVDEKFNITDCRLYFYNGKITKEYECGDSKIRYIEKKKNDTIIETEHYYYDFMEKKYFKTINYFDNGLEIKSKTYDSDMVCWSFTNKKYDKNRNVIQIVTFNDPDKSKHHKPNLFSMSELKKYSNTTIVYLYDSSNNWIEKRITNGQQTNIVKRKIEYYDFFDFINNSYKYLSF